MKLLDYVKGQGYTLEQYGARIGRSAATVSRLVNGVNNPDRDTMEAIIAESGGAVSPNDFFEMPDAPPRPPLAPIPRRLPDGH